HLARLRHELSLLQFDTRQAPSEEMVRASHTLCGIHRASGFPLIALTAGALEQCVLALQPLPVPLPTEALPALSDAIGGLGEFLGRVKERRSFNATDVAIAAEIQQELDSVRRIAASVPLLETQSPPEITVAEMEPEATEEIAPSSEVDGAGRETEAPQEEEAKAEVVAEAKPAS